MAAVRREPTSNQRNKEKKAFAVRLGKRLREVRESKGLTQEQLANQAGYYRTYVGHIENATYSPSVHTMWRLAKALKVDLSDLLKSL